MPRMRCPYSVHPALSEVAWRMASCHSWCERNFGAKSISEIKDKLAELGLSLKGSPVDYVSDDDYANPTFSDETQA